MNVFSKVNSRTLWWLFFAVMICWGCLLRFHDLGARVYWRDEAFTSFRLSGYTEPELAETLFKGEVVYPQDFSQFQINHTDRHLGDTVKSLTRDTHPPGYFVLLWLWTKGFGSSIVSTRAFSAAVSLLLLPIVFALARTLFEASPHRQAIAALSTALVAVSPFQVVLSSEARMYSLLPVLTTLAGLCLLRAVRPSASRKQVYGWWVCFALAGAASLYVHLLAVPMLAGYGLYVWVQRYVDGSPHWVRAQKQHLVATGLTLGLFLPWCWFLGTRLSNVYFQTRWTAETVPFFGKGDTLVGRWLWHGLLLFINGESLYIIPAGKLLGGLLAIAFLVWALVYLVRHTPLPIWSFLLISSGIIYMPLAVTDVLLSGQRSGIPRYFASSIGEISIAVAFGLVSLGGMAKGQRRSSPLGAFPDSANPASASLAPRLARWAIIFLLIGGVTSQMVAKSNYALDQHFAGRIANAVNQTPGAMLVSDAPFNDMALLLSLTHYLKEDTPLLLTIRPEQPAIAKFRDRPVFLYLTSAAFRANLKARGMRLQPISDAEDLFKIEADK
ncbi:MAG: glycosyltransferase family 39 protein [Cyanobacteria bacterium P01_D01_bin.105]